MKKRNKILALLMALVLIMTSVTVDYKKTKAASTNYTNLTLAMSGMKNLESNTGFKIGLFNALDDSVVVALAEATYDANSELVKINTATSAEIDGDQSYYVKVTDDASNEWKTDNLAGNTFPTEPNNSTLSVAVKTVKQPIKIILGPNTDTFSEIYYNIDNSSDVLAPEKDDTTNNVKYIDIPSTEIELGKEIVVKATKNSVKYISSFVYDGSSEFTISQWDYNGISIDFDTKFASTNVKFEIINSGNVIYDKTADGESTDADAKISYEGRVPDAATVNVTEIKDANGNVYTASGTVSSSTVDMVETIVTYGSLTIDLGGKYTDVEKETTKLGAVSADSIIASNESSNTKAVFKNIDVSNPGTISFVGKNGGIRYSVSNGGISSPIETSGDYSAESTALAVSLDYRLNIGGTTPGYLKYSSDNGSTFNTLDGNTVLEKGREYIFEIQAYDKFTSITGTGAFGGSEFTKKLTDGSNNSDWQEIYQVKYNCPLSETEINIDASIQESVVQPSSMHFEDESGNIITSIECVPNIVTSVTLNIVMPEYDTVNHLRYPVPNVLRQTGNISATNATIDSDFVHDYDDKIEFKLVPNASGVEDPNAKITVTIGNSNYTPNKTADLYLSSSIPPLVYLVDYIVNNVAGMYTTDGETIYYSAINGKKASITLKYVADKVNKYRFSTFPKGGTDFSAYPTDFTEFSSDKTIETNPEDEKVRFQITREDSVNGDTFGAKSATLILDETGPVLDIDVKSSIGADVVTDNKPSYTVTSSLASVKFTDLFDVISFTDPGTDPSGVTADEIYVKDVSAGTETKLSSFVINGNCFDKTYEIYGYDHVGNISNVFTVVVTNDLDKTTISATIAGWKKDAATIADGGITYLNNTQDDIVISLSATDNKLAKYDTTDVVTSSTDDVFKVTISGVTFDDAWVSGKNFDATNYTFMQNVVIPAGTLASGTYAVTAEAHDISSKNDKTTYSFTIVVDNDKADNIKVYAEEVNVADPTGIFADVKENYTGYNAASKLNISFTDENYDVAQKVNVKLGINDIDLSVDASGTTYTAIASFADIDEQFNVQNTECLTTITDKALNIAFSNLHKFEACDVKSDNIVIAKNPAALSDIKLAVENERFLNLTDSKLTGSLKFTGATMFVPEFLRFTLDEVGGESVVLTTENSGFTFTTSGENISFSFNTSLLKSDTEYTVTAYYYDIAAAKVQTAVTPSCVYDTTAPVITAEVDKTTSTVKLTMVEKYPDFANFETSFSGYNNEGTIDGSKATYTADSKAAASFINLGAALKNEAAWKNEGNSTYTTIIKMNLEGTYTFSVGVNDFSPLTGKDVASATFIYDVTAPDMRDANNTPRIAVLATESSTNSDYSQFDKEKATVIFELYELASTDVTVSCKLSDVNTGDEEFNITSGSLKREGSNFSGAFDINKNFKGTIHFKTKDGNGNVTDYNVDYANGLIIEQPDMHAQTSTATITDMNPGYAVNGIYNEDVQLKFDVKDTYSGIRSIKYTLNGVEAYADLDKTGGIVTTWSKNATITANHQNEGKEILAVLDVVDNAGYTTQVLQSYNIDVTSPVITVAYDRNTPLNEKYYKETRTATITIREYNFDPQGVSLIVKRDENQLTVAPNFNTDGVVRYDENGKPYFTYVMNYPFADDGDYEFTLSCTDMAGNLTQYGQTDSFTIDKTKPVITLTYDNNNVHNTSYYGESRTATITVEEHNFNANDIEVNLTASVEGAATTAPTVSAFATNGDRHTATVSFNKDADYTIEIEGLDLAGNIADTIAEQKFTIDLEAPEIEITGVKNNSSYNGEIIPVVVVKDGNYDVKGVSLKVEGGKNGTTNPVYTTAESDHGQTFTFENIAKDQGNDDCYTLIATAVDKAGHSTEVVVNYRVNRFGSTYEINDKLEAAIEKYYATASDEFVITEVNVDKVSECNISYTVDTDIVNLESGTDYSVKESTNSNGWKQYDYTLSGDTFDKEGVYTISISSKDEVGNVSDNKSKGLSMEFCIDNTAPVCIISGVEEGQKIERDLSAEIVVEAYDNIMFDTMQVYVNGSVVKTEADMADGKVAFVIEPSAGDQTLKVVCKDAAGNEKIEEVHFTFDVGILKSNSWLKIVIPIVAILLVGGGAFFIILAKKRKKEN